ncbi:hypothetical protein BVRB_5g099520 [Beta vulgaris subsp. vulgaris]|nr:hypothetical protein BVRB_5g099520 [Beta vulgaris subsp. vulgaris]
MRLLRTGLPLILKETAVEEGKKSVGGAVFQSSAGALG